MKIAVAYYRMSKDTQETSIPDQRAAVRKWAKEHGYRIIAEYIDEGISGDDTGRRVQFQKMIRDAQGGKFQSIIVWEIGRLGRFDAIEGGYWMYPLREAGIEIVSLDRGPVNWHDFEGRLIWGIEQEMKHSYLTNLSRDTFRGKLARAREGLWNGGPPPRGYGLKDGRLYVIPDEAALVRRMFRMFLEGYSLRGITERLNLEGVPARKAKHWWPQCIRAILTQRMYLGSLIWNRITSSKYTETVNGEVRTRRGRRKTRTQSKNEMTEWVSVAATHEPLIDQETFDAVQRKLSQNRTRTSPARNGGDFAFTGILKCGRCGSRMVCQRYPSGIMWMCANYMQKGAGVCSRNAVNQAELLELVIETVESELSKPAAGKKLRAGIAKLTPATQRVSIDQARERLADTESAVRSLESRLCRVDDDMVGLVQEQIRKARYEREAARQALTEAQKPIRTLTLERSERAAQAREVARKLRETVTRDDMRAVRGYLSRAIERITVWSEGTVAGKKTLWRFSRGVIKFSTLLSAGLVQSERAHGTSYCVKFRWKKRKRA